MKLGEKPFSHSLETLTIRQQLIALLLLVDMLFISVSTWEHYASKKRLLISHVDSTLRTVAVMARNIFPPDYHDRILGPDSVPDAEYQKIVDRYNQLCVSLGLEYIWSLMLIDGKIVFTSSTSPDKVAVNRKHAKFFEVHSNPELYAPVFDSMKPTFHTSSDKWGLIRVALIPGTDHNGRKYLFGASVTLAEVNRELRLVLWQSLLIGTISFFCILLVGVWIAHVVSKPIQRLAATIESAADGNNGVAVEEKGTCEVRTLAHHFKRLNDALQDKIINLEESRERLIDMHELERKHAQDDLASSEQRYFALLNFAVDGILVGTLEGVVTEANECMCALFGMKREEIVGKHVEKLPFTPESLKSTPFRFDLIHKGLMVVRERVIRRSDGSEVCVETHTKLMPGNTIQSIYHDISGRKQVERSLKEAYALLENAQKMARLGAWKWNAVTGQNHWTSEVYNILGIDRNFDINDIEKVINLFTPESRQVLIPLWRRAVDLGVPYEVELEHVDPSGERKWSCTNARAVIENGRVVTLIGNMMDITERKRLQVIQESLNMTLERRVAERTAEVQKYADQLRTLTGRLIQAEETERQRITHVLHEDLQQVLVASRMTLGGVCEPLKRRESQEAFKRVDNMLSTAIQLTRSLVHEITVPAVKEGELPDMIRWVLQEVKSKFGLTVDLTTDDGLEPVSENTHICLYRALQEILFNVIKHAKVMHAEVIVQKAANRSIRVTVRDEGDGFCVSDKPSKNSSTGGIGLFGIRERVEGLGGSMEIRSAMGCGTSIVLTVPGRDAFAPQRLDSDKTEALRHRRMQPQV